MYNYYNYHNAYLIAFIFRYINFVIPFGHCYIRYSFFSLTKLLSANFETHVHRIIFYNILITKQYPVLIEVS